MSKPMLLKTYQYVVTAIIYMDTKYQVRKYEDTYIASFNSALYSFKPFIKGTDIGTVENIHLMKLNQFIACMDAYLYAKQNRHTSSFL